MARRSSLTTATILAVLACYFWIGIHSGHTPLYAMTDYHYYELLADGFLHRQLSLPVAPRPELLQLSDPYNPDLNRPYRLQDLSLYNGKYYLFSGPTPAVLAFAPWKWATGQDLPQYLFVILCCSAGFLASVALFQLIIEKHAPQYPDWLQSLGIAALGFCTGNLHLLRWPSVYQVASACASSLLMLSLLCLYFAVTGSRRRTFLFLSAVAVALAVGARNNYLAVAMVPIGAGVWIGCTSGKTNLARFNCGLRLGLLAAVPILAVVLGLATYNASRFSDPLEPGVRYQLGGVSLLHSHLFQTKNIAPNLEYYFFQLPQFTPKFPFISEVITSFYTGETGFYLQERQFGLFAGAPVSIGIILLAVFWKELREETENFLLICVAATSLNFLPLLVFTSGSVRYFSDFLPPLLLLAIIGWMLSDGRLPRRGQLRGLFLILTLFGCALHFLANFPG